MSQHKEAFPFLSDHHWVIFNDELNDEKENPNSALAYQDSFIRWLPEYNEQRDLTGDQESCGLIHWYPYPYKAVLLGTQDARLTNLSKGIDYLEAEGYEVVLRPHGGLAVVSDPGVINVALVSDNHFYPLSIDEAYEQMVKWVRLALEPFGLKVESYEIPDSYCPGKFDLVVNGQKIGGIAQRRFKSGVTTAAYLSVNGNQDQRSLLIREFYKRSEANDTYPTVKPEVMTTIEELIGKSFTSQDAYQALRQVIEAYSSTTEGDFNNAFLSKHYEKALSRLENRRSSLELN